MTTVTTIGYGDMSPKSRSEILFVIFYMIAAGFVFAFVMGQMGDIISAYYAETKEQDDYMKNLKDFMDTNEIDPGLKKLASRYVAYYFLTKSSNISEDSEIFSLLTP